MQNSNEEKIKTWISLTLSSSQIRIKISTQLFVNIHHINKKKKSTFNFSVFSLHSNYAFMSDFFFWTEIKYGKLIPKEKKVW